jgi:hypothetical protein
LAIAGEPSGPGGMRAAAEAIDARSPAIFSAHGIEEGDALALATRFVFEYAYRGRVAIFWNATFAAREILDRHRGLLRVSGTFGGGRLALVARRFSSQRTSRVRELRQVRTILRATKSAALLFVTGVVEGDIGFVDLGFATLADADGTLIAARDIGAHGAIVTV